ncbi:hypothetical protein KIN20_027830 [Parelaphostrongylus tenuis]|uniref:ZP domain-containing protein n=1 Tax=Parelaphostrongylus tenuis TaxID=148309 RepID=A0AAD5QZV3_PARTN|nr:hypothetical protein KIN20_027830 [Parelaphostrongylus tenuis]
MAENVDYFDVICDGFIGTKRRTGGGSVPLIADGVLLEEFVDTQNVMDNQETPLNLADMEMSTTDHLSTSSSRSTDQPSHIYQAEYEVEGTIIDDSDNFKNTQHSSVKAKLKSDCRRSGITVRLELAAPTSGSLYVKDNFATCRSEFVNTTYAELHVPFPRSDDPQPRCPGIEIAPSLWSFSIAVQKNDVNSPSLVTSNNRLFNVTCDFTDMLSKEKEPLQTVIGLRAAMLFLVIIDALALRYGFSTNDGYNGDEIQSDRIVMQILQNGRPITTVPLGDEVTLKWTILDTTTGLDYFVDDCIAERVGGVAPHPEPLKIIEHG